MSSVLNSENLLVYYAIFLPRRVSGRLLAAVLLIVSRSSDRSVAGFTLVYYDARKGSVIHPHQFVIFTNYHLVMVLDYRLDSIR